MAGLSGGAFPAGVLRLDFFAPFEAAMDWIDANQLGRRNLSPEDRTRLIGRRYNRAKKKQGGTGANQHVQTGKTCQSAGTAQTLADEYNVSEKTVRNAGKYDAAATVIEQAGGSVSGAALQDVVKAAEVVRQVPPAHAKSTPIYFPPSIPLYYLSQGRERNPSGSVSVRNRQHSPKEPRKKLFSCYRSSLGTQCGRAFGHYRTVIITA